MRPALLSLDIATLTGFCIWDLTTRRPVVAGRFSNKIRTTPTKKIPADKRNVRLLKMHQNLDKMRSIAYECNLFFTHFSHEAITQGRSAGGQTAEVARHLEAIFHFWCGKNFSKMPVSYAAGTIKKHATGSGSAEKEKMLWFAERKWPELVDSLKEKGEWDDNVADALHLADLTDKSLNF